MFRKNVSSNFRVRAVEKLTKPLVSQWPFLLLLRGCSSVWSGHPHCIHVSHCFWADRSDLPYSACDDRGHSGQRRGPVAPTITVRLHHPHQEASLSAGAGNGASWVSRFVQPRRCVCLFFLHNFWSLDLYRPRLRKYNIRVEDIMVRDLRYITLNSSYRDLQEVLLTSQLKTLALVESRGELMQ